MEENESMAKMRVHELAKELEIESKNIVEFLKGTSYEVKAAASSLEDEAQAMVRKEFGKKVEAPKAEEPKKDAPKAETVKTEENGTILSDHYGIVAEIEF